MKAKPVNFERGQDPKSAMDVGMTPERKLNELKNKLKELGIEMEWYKSNQYRKGALKLTP